MSTGDKDKTKQQLIEELNELREKMVQLVALSELETIFRILPDIYFRLDNQGTVLDFKVGQFSDLYVKPELFLGRKIEGMLPPDVSQKVMRGIEDAWKTGELVIVEYSLPMPGGLQHYEARLLAFEQQILSVIRNITTYRQLERESARLQYFLRLNPNPTIETDNEGKLTYFNPAAAKEFPQLAIGTSDHPILNELVSSIELQMKDRKKLTIREIEINKQIYEQHISYIPEIERIQVYMNDITKRKQTETELEQHREHLQAMVDERTVELETINQQLQEEIAEHTKTEQELKIAKEAAESASRLKSQFLANMSHDIRTPLNSILGFANLMLKSNLDNKTENYIKKIINSGDGLLNLLNDILDFSKIEAGQLDIYPQTFLLEELLENLRSMFDLQFKRKGIKFEIKMDPQAEIPQRIYSDKWRVHQVLTNLISNAFKFTEKGTVTVEITFAKETDRLGFEVKDTGIGIPEKSLHDIFQPFTRLQSPEALEKKGTGIGLAICKTLVNLMGGEIKVKSQENVGSQFSFQIPAESAKAKMKPLTSKINIELLTALLKKTGNQLLIVDDNPVNQELIIEQLKNAGFHTLLTANNGKEAVEAALTHQPDLILMDIQMPVMDGNEAMGELRKKGFKNPIIALSAFAMKEHIEKSLNSGADAYITKPIDFDRFLSQICPYLREKEDGHSRVETVSTPTADIGNEIPTDGIRIKDSVSKRVREVFLKDARKKLTILNTALKHKGRNFKKKNYQVKVIAHTIKGNAGFLGLAPLENTARQLDKAFQKSEPDETIKQLTQQLAEILTQIIRLN